jgi:hypothetical protein
MLAAKKGQMWYNVGYCRVKSQMKNAVHSMDRTANCCVGECIGEWWFSLGHKCTILDGEELASVSFISF